MADQTRKSLVSIKDAAAMWSISIFSVRRAIDRNEIRSVTIGARRLIPMEEIDRVEKFGLGVSRKGPRPGSALREQQTTA
jgi:hypothetical protein